jgi:hypothetical protein
VRRLSSCGNSSLTLILLVAAAALGAAPTTEAQAIAWRATIEIATGGGYRGPWRMNESDFRFVDDPGVALYADGSAAVTWVDQQRKDVLFRIYGPDGAPRLAQPANVSRSPKIFSWLPRVALSPRHADDVYVLWQEIVFAGGSHGGEIFFAHSRDRGRTFSRPVNLSNTTGGAGKARINRDFWHNGSLDLALAPDGTLYAAWTEYEGPLFVSRSVDRGASFSRPLLVAGKEGTPPARAPALAVAPDGTVYLAWTVGERTDADIHLARSNDGGHTFGTPAIVARTTGYADAPKLAAGREGTLHLAYAQSDAGPFGRYHVRYARSRDGGATFEAAREISRPLPPGIESASFPHLTLDERGRVALLWELFPHPRRRPRGLAIAYSTDGGETFSTPAVVPGSSDPAGGANGSQQGLLMRKLATNAAGQVAVVNSSLTPSERSRVWMVRGELPAARRTQAD